MKFFWSIPFLKKSQQREFPSDMAIPEQIALTAIFHSILDRFLFTADGAIMS